MHYDRAQQDRILTHLKANSGEVCTRDDLITALYPDPDDEPENVERVIYMSMLRLRQRGVSIETVHGYRLVER